MSWLLRDGDVLAVIDGDGRGWPATIQGALVKRAPVLAHTFSCGRSRDVAWCRDQVNDAGEACLLVRRITTLAPRRVGPVTLKGSLVVAEPGAFERWRLQVGDRLEIRDT